MNVAVLLNNKSGFYTNHCMHYQCIDFERTSLLFFIQSSNIFGHFYFTTFVKISEINWIDFNWLCNIVVTSLQLRSFQLLASFSNVASPYHCTYLMSDEHRGLYVAWASTQSLHKSRWIKPLTRYFAKWLWSNGKCRSRWEWKSNDYCWWFEKAEHKT